MPAIDFSAALGRLLTDGRLRDVFAVDPRGAAASLGTDTCVEAQLLALKIEELEFQAEVLLRKRFEVIKTIAPRLVCRLGPQAWPWFKDYARPCWLQAAADALGFAEYACTRKPGTLDAREINRLRFALATSVLQFHPIMLPPSRPALQILVRIGKTRWREFVLSLGL